MDNSKNLLAHEGDGQQLIENFPVSFFSHAEAIFHLKEAGIELKKTRVADWLGSSRANVSQVIGRMQNSGLVDFGEDLELTQAGFSEKSTRSPHDFIYEYFMPRRPSFTSSFPRKLRRGRNDARGLRLWRRES